jgi:hypothetical protein
MKKIMKMKKMMKMKSNKHIVLVAVLSLIFTSCDSNNGLNNNELSGKEIPVHIRSLSVAEGGSKNLIRSSSQKEQEMFSTPVDDGMLLEVSIKQDESPLREAKELKNGSKFRVIALEAGKYHSHGDFTYGGNSSLPEFHVGIGKSYDFICLSYNTNALPSASGYVSGSALPALDVDNTKDLLWCKTSGGGAVTDAGVELDITLEQNITKVKVVVDCSYNQWRMHVLDNQVTIGEIYTAGTMDWSTGEITATGNPSSPSLTFLSQSNAISQTTNQLTIMPKSSGTITVNILAKAITGTDIETPIPGVATPVTFSTVLSAGVDYTIYARLKTPIFARSNIYWDNSAQKLTFVPAGATPAQNSDTRAGYQGVFFKWGSLVGISPVGDFESSTVIFVPTGTGTGASWVQTGWEQTTAGAKGWTAWGSTVVGNAAGSDEIPYFDGEYAQSDITYVRSNNFVSDDAQNTPATYSDYRGDICRFISDDEYRLPRSEEFGPTSNNGWGKAYDFSEQTTTAVNGTANLITMVPSKAYARNKTMDGVYFPASGYRDQGDGRLHFVGTTGFAWSSSARSKIDGHYLYFNTNTIGTAASNFRSMAIPVRCVLNK